MLIKIKIFFFCILFFYSFSLISEQVVVVGSGPAGLTAAIYTSRAGLSTLIIEGDEPGGQISLSHMIENFPGFPQGISGFELGENMRAQAKRFGSRIQEGKISHVDFSKRPFILKMEGGVCIEAESLIIASGSSVKWLGLASEKRLIGKGVSSCAICDGFYYKGQEVVVVGGGDTALEDALFLANYASKVTIVHRKHTLKASKYLQDKAFENRKIHFVWESVIDEIFDPALGQVTGVKVKNIKTQNHHILPCQGVFIAVGHLPNTDLFKGLLDINPAGYIVTNSHNTHAAIEGVFVAGDVADSRYRQAITAAGSGCMAGIDAYHFIEKNQE